MVVAPLIDLLEPVFGSDSSDESSDRQLAAYTQEIVDRLLDEASESLPVAVADVLLKEDHTLFKQIIDNSDTDRVKLVLHDYFEHFGAADLFVDMRELVGSRLLQENSTIYLNIGEVQYKNNKFPLYYIPLDVELDGSSIRVEFQGFVYVNKPACDYIAGELTRATGRVVPNPISERIFHQEAQKPSWNHRKTHHQILAGLECQGELDFVAPVTQFATGADFRIGDLSISLADSADEAIVNDYEQLMSGLAAGHPLIGALKRRVVSIQKPLSIESIVESDWREATVPERLVFESPLPLAKSNASSCRLCITRF